MNESREEKKEGHRVQIRAPHDDDNPLQLPQQSGGPLALDAADGVILSPPWQYRRGWSMLPKWAV